MRGIGKSLMWQSGKVAKWRFPICLSVFYQTTLFQTGGLRLADLSFLPRKPIFYHRRMGDGSVTT